MTKEMAIEILKRWHHESGSYDERVVFEMAIEALENAPDINVGNKWIPCDGCERKCEKWEHSKICQECDSTN